MKKAKNQKTGDKGADKRINRVIRNVIKLPKLLVGIDEVGRGPLAGPVTVGACALCVGSSALSSISSSTKRLIAMTATPPYKNLRKKLMEISGKEYPIGFDSKKMKESERDFWYETISKLMKNGDIFISVKSLSAGTIDKKGIAVCIRELVDANIKNISKKAKVELKDMYALLDGGLKTNLAVGSQKTIIKGDERELLISLASVYAKVTRDRHMKKLSRNPKYTVYGFDIHKGYGTALHRSVMREKGLSDKHRQSFCSNFTGKRG